MVEGFRLMAGGTIRREDRVRFDELELEFELESIGGLHHA
jgi:hypothetical protein